jgi:hypothetical protein
VGLASLGACNVVGLGDSNKDDTKKKDSSAQDEDDDDDDAPSKSKKKKDKKKAETKTDASAGKVKNQSRVAELFGVDGASTDLVPIVMDIKGVQLSRAKSWRSEPYADFASTDNTAAVKEQRARCYLTSRIQPSDVMAGIKLWSRSAGAAPASWSGPETIKIGPDGIAVDLYWGKDGVKVGTTGASSPGITVAMHPKEFPELLLVGIARDDTPAEMKRELVACLESFSKKK